MTKKAAFQRMVLVPEAEYLQLKEKSSSISGLKLDSQSLQSQQKDIRLQNNILYNKKLTEDIQKTNEKGGKEQKEIIAVPSNLSLESEETNEINSEDAENTEATDQESLELEKQEKAVSEAISEYFKDKRKTYRSNQLIKKLFKEAQMRMDLEQNEILLGKESSIPLAEFLKLLDLLYSRRKPAEKNESYQILVKFLTNAGIPFELITNPFTRQALIRFEKGIPTPVSKSTSGQKRKGARAESPLLLAPKKWYTSYSELKKDFE